MLIAGSSGWGHFLKKSRGSQQVTGLFVQWIWASPKDLKFKHITSPAPPKKQRESAGVGLICSMNVGKLVAFKPTLVNLGKKLTLCWKIWRSNTSLAPPTPHANEFGQARSIQTNLGEFGKEVDSLPKDLNIKHITSPAPPKKQSQPVSGLFVQWMWASS